MKPEDLKDNRGVDQEGCELLIMIDFALGRLMPDLSLHIPLKRRAVFAVLEARGQIVPGEKGRCSFLRKAPHARSSQSSALVFVCAGVLSAPWLWEESCVSEQETSGSLSILIGVGRMADPRKHEHAKCANLDKTEAEEKGLAACVHRFGFWKPTAGDSYFVEMTSVAEKLKPCSV